MSIGRGQPFIHIVFVWHFAVVALMGLTSFSLPWVSLPCQPAAGIVVKTAALWTDLFFFLLPGDWFPCLTTLNGLNITRTSVTERLHLAAAAKPNRQPVCLVRVDWEKEGRPEERNKRENVPTFDCYLPSVFVLTLALPIMKINPGE